MRFCSIEQLWEVATDGTRQHTLQLQEKEKCRGRFLGCFSDDFARRSFVRSLANEVGAAGASGFYTAPAAAAPSPRRRRASARSSSAGLRSNESGRIT